jgi:hypothetical protein
MAQEVLPGMIVDNTVDVFVHLAATVLHITVEIVVVEPQDTAVIVPEVAQFDAPNKAAAVDAVQSVAAVVVVVVDFWLLEADVAVRVTVEFGVYVSAVVAPDDVLAVVHMSVVLLAWNCEVTQSDFVWMIGVDGQDLCLPPWQMTVRNRSMSGLIYISSWRSIRY